VFYFSRRFSVIISAHKFDTFQRSAYTVAVDRTRLSGARHNRVAFADVIDRKSLSRVCRICRGAGSRDIIFLYPTRRQSPCTIQYNNIESASMNVTYLAHDDRTRLWVQRNTIILYQRRTYIDKYTRKSAIYACSTQPI